MHSIGEILGKRPSPDEGKKKRGGITSRRAEVVYEIVRMEGMTVIRKGEKEAEAKKRVSMRMKYWLGRTRRISPERLNQMMREAKEGRNRMALFNYLIKEYGTKK